ncbi:hypothetical protein MMC24_006204 [Lignoscripta atroalba]|nr:hypothetical protein [Lignoscripta atroalba]
MEQTSPTPFLGNIIEICIVSRDHRRTIDGLLRLGIGPFQIHTFNPSNVTSQKYYGQSAEFELKVCFAKQGSLVWEIMQPVSGPSIMADYLSKHGEGIHHVAFDCDHIPVQQRKDEFSRRGFQLAQEGIWHGKNGTCHFTFFDTEEATTTCFESYHFSSDWEDPQNTVWYPSSPTQASTATPATAPEPALLAPLAAGTTGVLLARKGKAIPLKQGQSLKIINTHGDQVVDLFAFGLNAILQPLPTPATEYLSLQHTCMAIRRTVPKAGDMLYSNLRKPMLKFVGDTSPGVHDTLIPACDALRYQQLGVKGHHESCAENMHIALTEVGYLFPQYVTPAPLNLFMNVRVGKDGTVSIENPESKEGDYVVLRAEENCLVVMSACPQDIIRPENNLSPTDCHYEIL